MKVLCLDGPKDGEILEVEHPWFEVLEEPLEVLVSGKESHFHRPRSYIYHIHTVKISGRYYTAFGHVATSYGKIFDPPPNFFTQIQEKPRPDFLKEFDSWWDEICSRLVPWSYQAQIREFELNQMKDYVRESQT